MLLGHTHHIFNAQNFQVQKREPGFLKTLTQVSGWDQWLFMLNCLKDDLYPCADDQIKLTQKQIWVETKKEHNIWDSIKCCTETTH